MNELTSNNYYEILGVSKNINNEDLKKNYNKIALKWHPDKNQHQIKLAEKNIKKINEAYEVLSNSEKRKEYDLTNNNYTNNYTNKYTNNYTKIFNNNDKIKKEFNFFYNNFFKNQAQSITTNLDIYYKVIVNLRNSKYNNLVGEIMDFDRKTNEYCVAVNDSKILIHRDNLIPCISKIRINNLQSHPQFNNQIGDIIGWDNNKLRFLVKLFIGNIILIKADNIKWPNNTIVKIRGLTNKTYYNNKLGRVCGFNGDKYNVKINDYSIINLHYNNIQITA